MCWLDFHCARPFWLGDPSSLKILLLRESSYIGAYLSYFSRPSGSCPEVFTTTFVLPLDGKKRNSCVHVLQDISRTERTIVVLVGALVLHFPLVPSCLKTSLACPVNTYLSQCDVGSSCFSCPINSTSPTGSVDISNCSCNTLTTWNDKYKTCGDSCTASDCLRGACIPTGQTSFICDCSGTGYVGSTCGISLVAFFLVSILRSEEVGKWVVNHLTIASVVAVLSANNLQLCEILRSGLFNKEAFRAPFTTSGLNRMRIAAFFSLFLKDIPQLVIQSIVASDNIDTITFLSLVASVLAITLGLIKYFLIFLVASLRPSANKDLTSPVYENGDALTSHYLSFNEGEESDHR